MSPITLLFSLFLVFVQGLESGFPLGDASLKAQHEGLVNDMKGLLVDKMKDFQSDVDGHVKNLKSVLETSPKEGEQRIHNMYEKSVQKLRQVNAPQECLNEGENHLMDNKQLTMSNFFRCSNATDAAKDVVAMTFAAGDLVADLLLSADQIFNGFNQCWSWNPITFVSCSFYWLKDVFSSTTRTLGELKNFSNKIADIISDIKAQIDYCNHQGQDKVMDHMALALNHVHDCTMRKMSK